MNVTLWGTRGSFPAPGAATSRYGGNTACVGVRAVEGSLLIVDAGTGIRDLGEHLPPEIGRIDILLSHLHMDHIIGLGSFAPLFRPDIDVHLWGPASPGLDLSAGLTRYLSPPLFPVRLLELPCRLTLHDLRPGAWELPGLQVTGDFICHPGPTMGYRISDGSGSVAYLSDHEPALGAPQFPDAAEWTSGFELAADADVLIHDAQYRDDEYAGHVGWGHSSLSQALAFARSANVGRMVAFHHDPAHSDRELDELFGPVPADLPFDFVAARDGSTFEVG